MANQTKFLVHVDLQGHELRNAVLGTNPGTAPGSVWFDVASKTVKFVAETGVVESVAPISYVDAAIAGVEAELASEITRIEGLISTEASDRAAADAALQSDIDAVAADLATESARAASAEAGLASDIASLSSNTNASITSVEGDLAAEVSRATAAEQALATDIANVTSDLADEADTRAAADVALQAAIDAEVARATAAEAGLQSQFDALDATYATEAEVNAAIDVIDAALTDSINAVASDLSDEVTNRTAAVSAEQAARESADAALQGAIDDVAADLATETSSRTAADTTLQANIDAEAAARAAADTSLSGDIAAVASDLADEVTARTAAVSAEQSAREAADATLQSNIDAVAGDLSDETTRALAAEAGIAADLAAEVTRATNAEGVIASDLASEVSRATAAEAALASGISDETTRAMAAESALDARLDTVETTIETLATSQELTDAIAQEVIDRNAAIAAAEAALEAAIADGLNGLDHKQSVKAATTEVLAGAASGAGATTYRIQYNVGTGGYSFNAGKILVAGYNAFGPGNASLAGPMSASTLQTFIGYSLSEAIAGGAVPAGTTVTVTANPSDPANRDMTIVFSNPVSSFQWLGSYSFGQFADTMWNYEVSGQVSSNALSGLKTIDGVSLVAGDRVLVKDQGTAADNGIYVVASGDWVRAADADGTDLNAGAYTFVESGTVNGGSGFVLLSSGSWTQFSGAGQITAGAGLTKTGNTLAVSTGNGIKVENDQVQLDGPVSIANGGTGATTEAGARTALNVPSRYATTIGDGSATSYVITHSLGTKDVVVGLRTVADDQMVMAAVTMSSTSTITVEFASAPASGAVRCVVIG